MSESNLDINYHIASTTSTAISTSTTLAQAITVTSNSTTNNSSETDSSGANFSNISFDNVFLDSTELLPSLFPIEEEIDEGTTRDCGTQEVGDNSGFISGYNNNGEKGKRHFIKGSFLLWNDPKNIGVDCLEGKDLVESVIKNDVRVSDSSIVHVKLPSPVAVKREISLDSCSVKHLKGTKIKTSSSSFDSSSLTTMVVAKEQPLCSHSNNWGQPIKKVNQSVAQCIATSVINTSENNKPISGSEIGGYLESLSIGYDATAKVSTGVTQSSISTTQSGVEFSNFSPSSSNSYKPCNYSQSGYHPYMGYSRDGNVALCSTSTHTFSDNYYNASSFSNFGDVKQRETGVYYTDNNTGLPCSTAQYFPGNCSLPGQQQWVAGVRQQSPQTGVLYPAIHPRHQVPHAVVSSMGSYRTQTVNNQRVINYGAGNAGTSMGVINTGADRNQNTFVNIIPGNRQQFNALSCDNQTQEFGSITPSGYNSGTGSGYNTAAVLINNNHQQQAPAPGLVSSPAATDSFCGGRNIIRPYHNNRSSFISAAQSRPMSGTGNNMTYYNPKQNTVLSNNGNQVASQLLRSCSYDNVGSNQNVLKACDIKQETVVPALPLEFGGCKQDPASVYGVESGGVDPYPCATPGSDTMWQTETKMDTQTIALEDLQKSMDLDLSELGEGMDITESEAGDLAGCGRMPGGKRLNHSEIEKRRRDKMNAYIVELADLIPMCTDINRKLDKLTVLRMAVQHIQLLHGTSDTPTEVSHLPSFISDEEVRDLILTASQGFTFAVSCDRGKILHVAQSVAGILDFQQSELVNQNLFDLIHHKDVQKVKDQLATNEVVSKERYIDAKTMKLIKTKLPPTQSQLRSGGRRLFVCRMRRNPSEEEGGPTGPGQVVGSSYGAKHEQRTKDKQQYVSVVCCGYIKLWTPSRSSQANNMADNDSNSADDSDLRPSQNQNTLVAVALPVLSALGEPPPTHTIPEAELRCPGTEFMSRHTIEGKFAYVDHRVTSVLGYVPQELIGTSVYEYCHPDNIHSLSQVHKQVLLSPKEKIENRVLKFVTKDHSSVLLAVTAFVFCNPWTKDCEHIVCNYRLIMEKTQSVTSSSEEESVSHPPGGESVFTAPGEPRHLPVPPLPLRDVSIIGRQIANQVSCSQSVAADSSTARGRRRRLHHSASHRTPSGSSLRGSSLRFPSYASSACSVTTDYTSSSAIDSSSGTETTDEAAMAIIMNLLEADAGLGGPVDFSDLPWPL